VQTNFFTKNNWESTCICSKVSFVGSRFLQITRSWHHSPPNGNTLDLDVFGASRGPEAYLILIFSYFFFVAFAVTQMNLRTVTLFHHPLPFPSKPLIITVLQCRGEVPKEYVRERRSHTK